jgi:hypothetical protein
MSDDALPVWEPTGEPAVDAALELLVIAEEVPLEEQQKVYEDVHTQLRQALTGEAASDDAGAS